MRDQSEEAVGVRGDGGTGGKADRGKERERFQANWKNTGGKKRREARRFYKFSDYETGRAEKQDNGEDGRLGRGKQKTAAPGNDEIKGRG